MEEWKQRLKTAREAAGLNKTTFASLVGVSNPTVTDWEKSGADGGIREIAGIRIAKICEVLGIDSTWLLGGDSAMPSGMQVQIAEQGDPEQIEIRMVKLRLQAGVTGFRTEPERRDGGTLSVRRKWVEKRGYDPAKLVAVMVDGESMESALSEDDIVVINTSDTKLVDGGVYAFNYEGEAVVKRLSRDAGMWWLTSDNPDQRKYHRKSVRGNECIVVGRVVLVIKESEHI